YRPRAELLLSMGRPAEARAAAHAADAIDQKGGGDREDHGNTLRILADIAVAEKRPADAIPLYRQALAILEGTYGADSVGIFNAPLGLGEAQLAASAVATAGPDAGVEKKCAAQLLVAQTRWASGRDRAGAMALARNARARLAALPYPTEELRDVDAWLARVAR